MLYYRSIVIIRNTSIAYLSRRIFLRCRHNCCIFVEPASSLVTDRVQIYGSGFDHNTPITVKASVECSNEKISFKSYGHYFTTDNGEFDLSSSESVGGTYKGVDCMGLFWSMVETGNSLNRFQVLNASVAKTYKFSVYGGHLQGEEEQNHYCSTSIERYFIGKGIKRKEIHIGKYPGTLFTPSGQGPFPAIITLYGGNRRGQAPEDAAAILSNFNFITLALQYFGADGLPDDYTQEPVKIEQFETVVDYLLSLENCHSVGVYGISKGGEICVAMMSHLSKVKAVAWINGHISSVATTTTYRGKVTPELGYSPERAKILPNGDVDCRDVMDNPEDKPLSIHPFEYSAADLLLVVGLDDGNWRSEEIAEIAKKRMDAVGKKNYELCRYPGLGHLLDAPFMPACVSAGHLLLPQGVNLYYGGADRKLHASSQEDTWTKIISFFSDSLKL